MTTDISEDEIIAGVFAPLASGYPGAFGLIDDCAAITPPPGTDLVVKTDPIAAGVHFLSHDDPADIGWKALAVNVSDLAAKGATPLAYVMALSFPSAPERGWLERFAVGLGEAQAAFGMHLVGGDTDRREGPVSISITAFGHVPAGGMVRRGTARPGDRIYVTGTIGDAALGLALRTGEGQAMASILGAAEQDDLVQRSLRPQPRLGFQAALRKHAAAAMDISDGLVKDLERMASASGVGAVLWLGETPLSIPAVMLVRHDPGLLVRLATAGDDYELLIAVPAASADAFERDVHAIGRVTRVGEFAAGTGTAVLDVDGQPLRLARTGYGHFG